MGNVKELRGRIKSVRNISQITRAMEMVATTKLRRFQDRAVASRPYTDEITGLVRTLARTIRDSGAEGQAFVAKARAGPLGPLFAVREQPKTIGLFVVTSDRGLCGSYNTNILAKVHEFMDADRQRPGRADCKYVLFVYGRKGYTYFYRRGYTIERYFIDPPLETITFRGARLVAAALVEGFTNGKLDEVHLFYTAFKSMVRHVPTVERFLSLAGVGDEEGAPRNLGDTILEPSAEVIFQRLVPKYLETKIFNALMESVASEYASRRIAMKNATDAANDMVKELKRTYNRARQEGITKDLLDIVGGAEALR